MKKKLSGAEILELSNVKIEDLEDTWKTLARLYELLKNTSDKNLEKVHIAEILIFDYIMQIKKGETAKAVERSKKIEYEKPIIEVEAER